MLYSPGHLTRYMFFVGIAMLITAASPLNPSASMVFVIPVLYLFAFLVGFVVNRALERKQAIATSVATELSRLRRLEHLSEMIGNATWRRKFHAALVRFHERCANQKSFDQTTETFREVTHLVYEFHPKSRHQELLYEELLDTTGELALERQKLSQALSGGVSWYGWLVIQSYAGFVIILMLLNRAAGVQGYLSVAFGVAGVFLIVDLLYRLDRMSPEEKAEMYGRFRTNMPQE